MSFAQQQMRTLALLLVSVSLVARTAYSQPPQTCEAAASDACFLIVSGDAKKLDCMPAAFSPPIVDPAVVTPVVSAGDGCPSPLKGVEGAIALMERGKCSFGQKALNAQAGGALSAIIWDNKDAPLLLLQAPGTAYQPKTQKYTLKDDKGVAGEIKIPVISVVKADGEKLEKLAADAPSDTFVSIEYDQNKCNRADKPAVKKREPVAARKAPEQEESVEEREERTRLRLRTS